MTKPRSYTDYPAQAVHDAGAQGASIRWVISQNEGAENYALRVVELEPGGNSPHHNHWFEHENFVLEGEGTVTINDQVFPIQTGDVIFVPGGTPHQYRNTGDRPLKFLCGIPMEWIREAKAGPATGS
jgi:quercetin dioxygenase-like cupin family protein